MGERLLSVADFFRGSLIEDDGGVCLSLFIPCRTNRRFIRFASETIRVRYFPQFFAIFQHIPHVNIVSVIRFYQRCERYYSRRARVKNAQLFAHVQQKTVGIGSDGLGTRRWIRKVKGASIFLVHHTSRRVQVYRIRQYVIAVEIRR